ncbi:MAG: hypothetical protein U0R64_10960 [Candidatus Nanopelagicales bacterium]
MTWNKNSIVAGSVASFLLLGGVVAAPNAQAYPPGKNIVVQTNKVKYKKGQKIKTRAMRIQPRCKVRFQYRGKGFKKYTVDYADKHGVAKSRIKFGPTKKGKYKIRVQVLKRNGCKPEHTFYYFKVK